MTAEPTPYDKVQDTEIEALKEITTTSYTPPDQTEYSYPIVGQPMNDEQWQYVTLGLGDGILDEGGHPYWLRVNESTANTNSTNTMLLTVSTTTKTAQASLRGFYHRLVANKVLHFEGVTAATTYYVVLRYDPLGHDTPGGPITVEVVTSLDTTMGKFNLVLWSVARKPNELLSDAVVTRYRPRVAPSLTVAQESQMPDPKTVLWGSTCHVHRTNTQYLAVGAASDTDAGPTEWKNLNEPNYSYVRPDTGLYRWTGHGSRPSAHRVGSLVVLEGRIARAGKYEGQNFNAGTEYQVMNLPEEVRPISERRFHAKSAGFGGQQATVRIGEDGKIIVQPTEDAVWIGLDGIVFTLVG